MDNKIFQQTDSFIKEKSLFWQISTMVVTWSIFGGLTFRFLIVILDLIWRSRNIFYFLIFLIIYIMANFIGLYIGIMSVIIRSKVYSEKENKIILSLLIISSFWTIYIFLQFNILILIALVVTVPLFYFYLKHLYQKSLNWQINRWSILGAKKFQYSIIAVSLVLMLLFIVFIMASIYLFIEGKNDFIYSLAPNAAIKAQLEKLKQKYSPEKRLDQEKIAIGDLISNMLNAYNSIGVAYPQTINNVYKDVLITQSIGGGKKLYQHVKEDDFSYQVLNGGHDFTLCVELTTGRKCWGYDKRAYSSMYRDKWDWNNPTYRKCVNNEDCVAVRCCDYRGLAVNRNYESLYNKNCTPSECINAEILRGSICENNICALKTLETLDKPDTKDKNDYFSEIKTTGEVQNDRDSDSDFLSDEMEQRFATNKNNTDTDNDGHPDGEEVRNGYNPNGPGTIEDSLDRDKKRLADIKQIQLGLELYFNDEGKYPGELKFGGSLKSSKNMIMSAVPKNQTVAGSFCKNYYPEFIYLQRNNGESYFLTYCLETPDGVINAGSHTATPGKVFD